MEAEFSAGLDLQEYGYKWRDAIEFCLAGSYQTLRGFWSEVREEYFRLGGEVKREEVEEIVFD